MPKYVSIEKRGVALPGRWIIATIANAKLERAVPIWILATLQPLSKIEKGCAWGKNRTSVMLPTIPVRVDKQVTSGTGAEVASPKTTNPNAYAPPNGEGTTNHKRRCENGNSIAYIRQ